MQVLTSRQKHYLDFLLAMTEKEIKARYKFAFLGFLWIVLNPLLQMIIMGFIFQFFVPVKVNNYFLFLFVGLLPWNFFSMTIAKNTPMIINERMLIQKAKFPRESIILAIVLSNLFHFFIAFFLLLFALFVNKIFQGYTPAQLTIYVLRMFTTIPVCLWLTFMTSGFSLLFSALNVKYRDINFIIQAILPLWFYATPIVYTLDLLPQKYQFLFALNPMTSVIQIFQSILLNQNFPSSEFTLINILIGLILSISGFVIFKKESPYFDDWV